MILTEVMLVMFGFGVGWIVFAAVAGAPKPRLVVGDRLLVFSDVVEIVDIDRRHPDGAVLTVRVVGQRRYPRDARTQRGWVQPRYDA